MLLRTNMWMMLGEQQEVTNMCRRCDESNCLPITNKHKITFDDPHRSVSWIVKTLKINGNQYAIPPFISHSSIIFFQFKIKNEENKYGKLWISTNYLMHSCSRSCTHWALMAVPCVTNENQKNNKSNNSNTTATANESKSNVYNNYNGV